MDRDTTSGSAVDAAAGPVRYETPPDVRPDATVIRDDRGPLRAVAVGSALLIAEAVALVVVAGRTGEARLVGLGVALGVLGAAGVSLAVWRLANARPRMILDPTGLTDLRFGFGYVPWTEVLAARLSRSNGHPFLCLRVRDPAAASAGSRTNPLLVSGTRPPDAAPDEIAISVDMTDVGTARLLALANRYRAGPGKPD